jgi:RNA polymerase sigma-70 factor (ECF subfamily)
VDIALLSELKDRFSLNDEVKPITHEVAGSADLSGRNVRRTDMEEAVQTLPPSERLLFLLHDVEGYKPPAIAQLLQMTEQQVNRTLISARIRMRRALAEVQQTREKAA